jgi:hypothetical protein
VGIVGLFIVAMGLSAVLSPDWMRRMLDRVLEKSWLAGAAIFRLVVGVLFILAASSTWAPTFIMVLGVFFVVAGLSVPLAGRARIESMARWWLGKKDFVLRGWGLLALVLGAFIARAGL